MMLCTYFCMPMESLALTLFRQYRNRVAMQSGKGRHKVQLKYVHINCPLQQTPRDLKNVWENKLFSGGVWKFLWDFGNFHEVSKSPGIAFYTSKSLTKTKSRESISAAYKMDITDLCGNKAVVKIV